MIEEEPRYVITEEGEAITIPEPEEELAVGGEKREDELAGLFEAPKETDSDMETDDLLEVTEEDVFGEGGEDMSDLLDVKDEDIMGEDFGKTKPQPKPVRKLRYTTRRYTPPTSLGGIR